MAEIYKFLLIIKNIFVSDVRFDFTIFSADFNYIGHNANILLHTYTVSE